MKVLGHDALMIEIGSREGAEVTAQVYRRDPGKAIAVGDAIPHARRPAAIVPTDPATWGWGGVTPDFYNQPQNHAVHVVNHELARVDNVARTVRFLRGRARYFARCMPPQLRQSAFVDDRGQSVPAANRDALADGLAGVMAIDYLSERDR